MSILDIDGLLPGLLPAAYRGIPFWMPDVAHEVGRRTLVTLFPGIDAAAFDDQGRHDGPIRVGGLIIGDDYVAQALALQAAFQTAGPGTLLHPWFGEITVVIAEPAEIRLSSRALGLIQFDVSFFRADVASAGILGTLADLLSAVSQLALIPARVISAVIGTAAMAVATWSTVTSMATSIGDVLGTSIASATAAPLLIEASLVSRAALTAAAGASASADNAAAIAVAIGDVVGTIGTTAIGQTPSAIGSASTAVPASATIDARSGAALLLDIGSSINGLVPRSRQALGLRLCGEVSAVAEAVRVAAEIDYESRQDASAWRENLAAAIDSASQTAFDLAPDYPAAAALAQSRLAAVRAQLGRDMNEIIGRLPSVFTLTPPAPVSAWLIAQHVAGDAPADVVPMFADIIRRNRLAHPGFVAGPVEILA